MRFESFWNVHIQNIQILPRNIPIHQNFIGFTNLIHKNENEKFLINYWFPKKLKHIHGIKDRCRWYFTFKSINVCQ